MEYILRICKLTKTFGGLVAINEVSAEIPERKIFGIIGPNGAGKTTLFNMLTGIYRPNQGQVLLGSIDITGQPAYQIASLRISRTFQNLRLFRKLTALENVMVGFHTSTMGGIWDYLISTKRARKEKKESIVNALQLLNYVGLADKYDTISSDLPYGDQKLLEIARALALKPKLLLLDEPSSGMNPSETNHLIKLIREINHTGITVMVIEHNMKVIMEISDRIMVLDHGMKIAEDEPGSIRKNDKVIDAYLGRA
jgi:branched-chain amino acid transport system ATP-binding protein